MKLLSWAARIASSAAGSSGKVASAYSQRRAGKVTHETEDVLSRSVPSRRSPAVLAVRALGRAKRPKHAAVLPPALCQSNQRLLWHGRIRLRRDAPGFHAN